MESILVTAGYPALFLVSFLASTVLPLGSEWLLILQIAAGSNATACVVVATAGNLLGALTTYWIGLRGGDWFVRTALRIPPARQEQAIHFFERYGSWALIFSWLPVVGDPLCLIGGVLRVSLIRFTLLAGTGKLARYATVAWLTVMGKKTFFDAQLIRYLHSS